MRLPKWGMGGWKLTWVNNQTQKILHTAIRFLWLISFFWNSKDVRWSNNNRCSKIKLVWKLIFLNGMSNQLIGSWTCVTEWSSNNRSEWLVIITFHMVHTFHYSKGHKFARQIFQIWLLLNYIGKTIDAQTFLKLATGQNQRMNMKQKMIITGVL